MGPEVISHLCQCLVYVMQGTLSQYKIPRVMQNMTSQRLV